MRYPRKLPLFVIKTGRLSLSVSSAGLTVYSTYGERLCWLIVEVMYSDLWNNPDATRYGWCSEVRKEEDYYSLLTRFVIVVSRTIIA